MTGIDIKGLQVMTLYVSDLERSVDFYVNTLGFTRLGEVPPGLTLRSGELTLYMEPGKETKKGEAGITAEFSPCFETESVRTTYEILSDSGVTIHEEYSEYTPEFAIFKILDPDGNVIEFAGKP